jgi:hypothetical protein
MYEIQITCGTKKYLNRENAMGEGSPLVELVHAACDLIGRECKRVLRRI